MSEFEYNDDLVPCTGNDYDSSFESDRGTSRKSSKNSNNVDELRPPTQSSTAVSSDNLRLQDHFHSEQSREEKRRERYAILALDAYSRHKKLVNDYLLCYKGQTAQLKRDTSNDKSDSDVLRENHRFLWDDAEPSTSDYTWGQRLAKKYYNKLFKEYCISDLRFYQDNKIAFRWRTEQEVVIGKGQFSCGEKKCKNDTELRSWEVNFAYVEHGERKNALVKVRLCPECSHKLNYRKQRKEVSKKRKRRADESGRSKSKKAERKQNKKRREGESKHKKKRSRSSRDDDLSSDSSDKTSSEGEEVDADEIKVVEEKRVQDDNPWTKPAQVEEEPNLEDEFDSFLDDMFL